MHEAPATGRRRMLRVKHVAEMLDLPEKRVYILVREGIIPHVRLGRAIRFNEGELEAWLAAGGGGYGDAEGDARPRARSDAAESRALKFREELDALGAWQEHVSELTGQERSVLNGLLDGGTLAEVAAGCDRSRERVRQIRNKAMRKLKYHIS